MAEKGVARKALKQARKMKATPKERKALILAGLVESGLQHSKYGRVGSGDRDSVGFLQQRPSQGWGPAGESVERDASQFLRAARAHRGERGSAGRLAQAVQRSAFPERYDQQSSKAEQILRGSPSEDEGGNAVPSVRGQRVPNYDYKVQPGKDNSEARKGLLLQYLREDYKPDALLSLSTGLTANQDTPDTVKQVRGKGSYSTGVEGTPASGGGGGDNSGSRRHGTFNITGPNPGRLNKGITRFAKQVAGVYGAPVTGSDGTGHSRNTVSGNLSQHTTGDATDIPAAGTKLRRMGQAALIAAGMSKSQARKQKGGLFNVNGKQIIFATNQGGNHFDHLHIGS